MCQDSVIDWLTDFAERLLKAEKDDYTLVTDAKNEPKVRGKIIDERYKELLLIYASKQKGL